MSNPTPSLADQHIPSLPTITGNGIFEVNNVVPHSTGSFEPHPNNPSNSYSYPLMDPAKLIGSASTPYMNVALPAYITTLYKNVYNINTNLTNDISGAAADDREYPSSYAVQQYVQSQISPMAILPSGYISLDTLSQAHKIATGENIPHLTN